MINKFRIKISEILTGSFDNKDVQVWGWIKTSRFSKNVGFIHLNDGSCFEGLQLVLDNSIEINRNDLLTGTCISVKGKVVASQGKEQGFELLVSQISMVGVADTTYPLQKKQHSYEFLREIPHLRGRTNTFLAVMKVRNQLAIGIHNFFQQRNFTYIHSPILTTNDCEGGGETFQVTTLQLDKLSKEKLDYSKDFFGKPVFLTVSGQLEAEPYALSLGEVYTFGPTFRADPSDTPRHASEFWMIEPEMAFYDAEDLRHLIEDFIKSITNFVKETCKSEIDFFSKHVEPDLSKRYSSLLENDFKVITFEEAISIVNNSQKDFERPASWENDLSIEHERYLVDEYFKCPVFVTNYPENFKAFYMRINEDNRTVACLDLLVPGIGEIITGSQREERLDLLESRLISKGLEKELYQWYLETRKWGTAPHSGFGLGFERMLMYLTGMKNIKDVIPFPRAGRKVY